MDDCCLANADGDMLIVPQQGVYMTDLLPSALLAAIATALAMPISTHTLYKAV